jgi:zinc protease
VREQFLAVAYGVSKSPGGMMNLARRLRWLSRAGIPAAALLGAAAQLGAQAKPAQRRAAQAPAQAVKATKVTTVEGITEYSLPNGLRVLLFPDQSKPTVTVNITYLVGSRHEGYGETGMAHLLEHMVFKGSTNHRNITKELDDHGSRPNGTTSYDRTNYYETVPATDANLEWALDLEADRMVNSFIAKKDLETEFSVVRNEMEAGENNPTAAAFFRMLSAAYRWHGYGRSTIGNRSDVENVPIERLQAFYRKYYQPDNAVLVVAGKFDPAKALALIETKFGRIPRPKRSMEAGNLLFATYTTEPVQDGERVVTVSRVGDTQILMAGYHVPAGSHPDFPAVSVLQLVLTDNPSGRLYKALVDSKLVARTSGGFNQLREPGMLYYYSELRKDQSFDSAQAATTRTIDALRTSPITAEEVERAKAAMLKNTELMLNNSERVGLNLTQWSSIGDWRLLFLNRDRIAKVTPADVQRVAAAYLKPSNRTVAMFVPTPNPDRAEIPATPNVVAMVADYKGSAVVQAGEAFDASPRNIDARTKRAALPNGMQLTLLPKQTRGNRVVAQIALRHGTEETLTGKAQTPQFVTSLLSRGTTALTRQQVKDSLDKLKAQVFMGGAGNNVLVSIETLKENFVPVLDLVAQQLRSPRFDAEEFEKLKQERLAQIEQIKSEPQFLANIALQRKLNPKPKGNPLYTSTAEEQIADINAVTLEQVRAFHRDFFGASYSDFAAIGDFDVAEVTAAATRLFGDWKNPQPFARIVRTYVVVDSSTQSIETPDKANAALSAGQNLVIRDDDPDWPALYMVNYMLGGGINSHLFLRLRQKEGISYNVGSGVSAQTADRVGLFNAGAIYAPQNVERLLRGFREEIDRVRTEGFTAQELDAAKSGYLQARTQGRANDQELIGTLVNRRFYSRTMAYDEDYEKKIQALTVEQVNAAAKKHLDPSKLVIVRAGDFAKNPPVKATP